MATAYETARHGEAEDENVLDRTIAQTQQNYTADLMALKMENECIMSECRTRPRDFALIKKDLRSQLESFPDLAEKAIYSKPVGKDDKGKQQLVRGLSIRAAETLAEAYGFNRVRSDVTPLDDGDKVKVEATFTDFQKGRIWQDGGVLSQYYKGRDGRNRRIPDDRFFNIVCKAEASKRVREVILRSVNAGLKAWFFDECEKMLDARLEDKEYGKILREFETLSVSQEMLEQLVGKPVSMGWTVDDKRKLLGIFVALRDGETSIAEVFEDHEQSAPKVQAGPVKSLDLTTPKKAAETPKQTQQQTQQREAGDEDDEELGASDPLGTLDARLAECGAVGSVNQLERSIVTRAANSGALLTAEQATELSQKCEARRVEIRAKKSGGLFEKGNPSAQ